MLSTEDIRTKRFPLAPSGYETSTVDHFLAEIAATIAELREQTALASATQAASVGMDGIDALRAEIAELRRDIQSLIAASLGPTEELTPSVPYAPVWRTES
ncbi:MAG: DivIVA domain-containing protein [Propionibacteriaceae bacterium]|nr:DivIVA domain-containing protein [Propionibacteriaceae bacterium]